MKETLNELHERIGPTLKEYLDGFVIVGYATNPEGKRERVMLADGGGDAAISDGLRPFMRDAIMWAEIGAKPKPKPKQEADSQQPPP